MVVTRLSAVHIVIHHLRSCCKWASWLCLLFCRDSQWFKHREVLVSSAPECLTLKAQVLLHSVVCNSLGDKHALQVLKQSERHLRDQRRDPTDFHKMTPLLSLLLIFLWELVLVGDYRMCYKKTLVLSLMWKIIEGTEMGGWHCRAEGTTILRDFRLLKALCMLTEWEGIRPGSSPWF